MSRHHTNNTPKSEHGTTASYVIGFVLSLVFTIIPYYLVVKHVLSGNQILATILVFAVLQMIIQIVFFLHLGRQKKPNWQFMFFVSTVGIILVVIVGSLWIMHHLHYNMTPVTPLDASRSIIDDEAIAQIGGQKTGACQAPGTNHQIVIKDGQVSPTHTSAHQCDTLTFINQDGSSRDIIFDSVYAGESELTVRKGRNETMTLSQTGTYQFRDHMHPAITGDFIVTK
jgi:cytochrome o ubiquinol oxidase operon protein cyoD